MKKCFSIEVLEEEGFRVSDEDRKVIVSHQERKIELTYDDELLRIYNEGGEWIADLIDCNK